jgi:hypothetical protein
LNLTFTLTQAASQARQPWAGGRDPFGIVMWSCTTINIPIQADLEFVFVP